MYSALQATTMADRFFSHTIRQRRWNAEDNAYRLLFHTTQTHTHTRAHTHHTPI